MTGNTAVCILLAGERAALINDQSRLMHCSPVTTAYFPLQI